MATKKTSSKKESKKEIELKDKEEAKLATKKTSDKVTKKEEKKEAGGNKTEKVKKTKKEVKKVDDKKKTKKSDKEGKKIEKKVAVKKKEVELEDKADMEAVAEAEAEEKALALNENKPDEGLARLVIEEGLDENEKNEQDLKKLEKTPESMAELISLTGYKLKGLKKGQEVWATITDINKRTVYFDIGAKTEGILIDKEMPYVEDYVAFLKVGDTLRATVVSPENDKNQILLSIKKSATTWKWSLFRKYKEMDAQVEVRGLDINKGGMIARLMNVRGFIPVSQFGRKWVGKLDKLYNKVFFVKVIEVDQEKNRLIFSEKAVSEAMVLEKQQDLLKEIKKGEVYKGQISGVMPFGIFVRVMVDDGDEKTEDGFLDGLVHISEISWEKVNNVASLFEVGQEIEVQVIDVDENSGKLNLSIKRLKKDPWDEIADKYPVDSKCKGKITRMAPFGAFAEIEKGIEGLIHISKIPSESELNVGDKVDCYIETMDKDSHRISLGLVLSAKPVGYN